MKKPQAIMSVVDAASSAKTHLGEMKDNFLSRLTAFTVDRDKSSQKNLENNFINVLEKWGIYSGENIGNAIFYLWMRFWLFTAFIAGYGLIFIFTQTVGTFMVFMLLAIPCGFAMLTTLWRIWVLKHTRFVPFTRWVASIFGLCG